VEKGTMRKKRMMSEERTAIEKEKEKALKKGEWWDKRWRKG
jgi:hypothetical protein